MGAIVCLDSKDRISKGDGKCLKARSRVHHSMSGGGMNIGPPLTPSEYSHSLVRPSP